MEGKEGEVWPPGVTEHDLMLSVISPYLDSTMTKAVLKELVGKCLYILTMERGMPSKPRQM